jgi:hypothetical protein
MIPPPQPHPPEDPVDPYICLYYDYFVFNATAGQEIRVNFQTSNPLDFYVTSLSQLHRFTQTYCGTGLDEMVATAHSSSYDLDWVAHQSGQYALLFATHRYYGDYITIHFTAHTYSSSVETSTLTNTITTTFLTQYFATIALTESGTNAAPNISDTIIMAAVAFILIAAITLIAIMVKRRKHRGDS